MFDDTLTDVVLADFHILESPCINTLYDHGPQFHLNLQCPTCETFKEAFVCCDCIKNDSIFSWKSGKISFPQNSDRIVTVRRLVNDLNRKLHRIRQAMTRCHTSSQQLLKQQASLVRHFITVAQRKKLLVADLDIVNRQIKQMLDTYFEELLGVYFVTDLSADGLSPDKFVCSPLHIDRENILSGPEPTPSSHTALTYCSVAIRVSTILLDVWLPVCIRRNLHLVGSFLSALPQRDDMGRVYFAVIHAVHLLCQSRGIDIKRGLEQLGINVIPGRYTFYNPLFGLYCLGNLISHNTKSTSPAVPLSSPCFVEKGEEVDEMFGLLNDEHSTLKDKQAESFSVYEASSSDYIYSSNKSEAHDSRMSLECWELVSVTSPLQPKLCDTTTVNVRPLDPSQHPGPLSKVWLLAKGIMGTSEPSDQDELYRRGDYA
ncbi:cassette chromosome recombinase b [Schistosoma japonicum]|nr:cassette chromosome recombinase b [Schistosoma japonicum]